MLSSASQILSGFDREKFLLLAERGCRWGLVLVFVAAAAPKIIDSAAFAATVNAYGMLPRDLVQPVALLLPPLELLFAYGLARCRLWGDLGIAALLLFFTVVLAYAIWLGLDIDCGCFGPEDPEHTAFSGLRTALARDLAMLAALTYSFWHRSSRGITRS